VLLEKPVLSHLVNKFPAFYRNRRFQVEVLRVVTSCSVVVGYQRFRDPCCFHLQGEVFQVEVFRVVTSCCVAVGYQRFRGPCCFHLQGEVFQVEALWVVTPFSVVVGSQRFRDPCCLLLQGEVKWRQQGPLKRRYPTATLHGITTQKSLTWSITALKASNSTRRFFILFKRISYWTLSWAKWIHTVTNYLFKMVVIFILPSTLSSRKWSLSLSFSPLILYCIPQMGQIKKKHSYH